MKQTRLATIALASLLAVTAGFHQTHAAQIQGAIAIDGGVFLDSTDLGAATQAIAWSNPEVTSVTGDYDTYLNPNQPLTMSAPWVFNIGIDNLWSAGGFTFDLITSAVVFQNGGFLVVQGTGLASGNGFDPTPGVFRFTTQEPDAQGSFSFSASVANVPCTGTIGDFVWQDTNGNGCQDPGEPGIAGAQVDLYQGCGPNAVLVRSVVTDANGRYLFGELCAGEYTVGFTTPAGYVRTLSKQSCTVGGQPSDVTDSDCSCTGGTACGVCVTLPTDRSVNLNIDCGYIPLASIGDRVWIDANGNGIQDGSEVGLAGVTVDLYSCADVLMGTTTTDANGIYGFGGLMPGNYYVKFLLPVGYVFSPPDQGLNDAVDSDANPFTSKTICTTLVGGENDLTWDAGVTPISSICGYVYHDVDNDGILDAGEPPIENVVVTLSGTDNLGQPVLTPTLTDGTGRYCFDNLRPGTYTISETQPSGYIDGKDTQGTPGGGTVNNDQFANIPLAGGVHGDNNNFGELKPVVEDHGGCRTTGGGRQAMSFPPVDYVTHGGQLGAPVGSETPFTPDSPCIQGNWEHVRHEKGGTRGNFHAKSFDSLMCACLGCPEDPNAPVTINGLCNPGSRTCGPEPRKAPANKITFSGVGDYALTHGSRERRSVLFRVDLEDRSEPGNSHAKGSEPPHDRHRIRIWILTPAELAQLNNPSDRLLAFRQAIAASAANTPVKDGAPGANGSAVFGVRAPDIDDGGEMTHGNHQIHPSIKDCP